MPNQQPAVKKALNKTQLLAAVADEAGLAKGDVKEMFDALETICRKQLGRNSPGVVIIPGLLKIQKIKKPARPAKKGVPNPFKPGELMDVAAKPAKNVLKVRPLKKLKDMVA
jgi:nucleoid DNA-binding protein